MFEEFRRLERGQEVVASEGSIGGTTEETSEDRKEFIWNTLLDYPGYIGGERVWELYKRKSRVDVREEKGEFLKEFRNVRAKFGKLKEKEKTAFRKKREVRRQHKTLMGGFSEKEEMKATEGEFGFSEEQLVSSLREDVSKAKYYADLCEDVQSVYPSLSNHLTDSIQDMIRATMRAHIKDELRPVLTHELGDFTNPYLMLKTSRERLLHKVAVRSKFEENLVEALLDDDLQLAKLRSNVDVLPPEVCEPLMAFRGVTDWSADATTRLSQKLDAVRALLDVLITGGPSDAGDGRAGQEWGFSTRTRSDERLGGWNVGRPESSEMAELKKVRYPTLQRVAHSLSGNDAVYRSSTAHMIDVLERSKGWSFSDKIKAVNTMKEVYDNLPNSNYYKKKLDKAMPINRLKRRQFLKMKLYKTFPRNWRTRSRLGIYHKSFVATKSLAARQSERKQKDADRKKKEEREKKQAQATKKKK
jgi:hypothetical protein